MICQSDAHKGDLEGRSEKSLEFCVFSLQAHSWRLPFFPGAAELAPSTV